jgi:hypothetical protein
MSARCFAADQGGRRLLKSELRAQKLRRLGRVNRLDEKFARVLRPLPMRLRIAR